MVVAADKDFLSWVYFLKLYQRGMCDLWKLKIPSLSEVYRVLDTCPRAENLEEIKGKKLLVMGESGYGDHVWFYRYLKELNKISDMTLFCPERIAPLMLGIKTIDIFPQDLREYDCWIWLFDFLFIMNDLGDTGRYLEIPPKKLLSPKPPSITRIGFALGNADTPPDMRYRNIDLEVLNYFMADNIETYNFSDIENYFCENNIYSELKDFTTTCQYIQEMDFMVCADNVNLHLAGALGKKAYALYTDKHEQLWFELPESSTWYDSVIPIMVEVFDTPRTLAEKIRLRENLL